MSLILQPRTLYLERLVTVRVETIIETDTDVLKSILAIISLLYAIILYTRPAILFFGDVIQVVDYTVRVLSVIFNSVSYGFS